MDQLLAGIFPAVVMTILSVSTFSLALLTNHHVPRALMFSGFASAMLGWALIPGMALFVGVLSFLKLASG